MQPLLQWKTIKYYITLDNKIIFFVTQTKVGKTSSLFFWCCIKNMLLVFSIRQSLYVTHG